MDTILLVGLGRIGFKGFGPASAKVETHFRTIHDRNDLKLVGAVDSDHVARKEFQRKTGFLVWEDLGIALEKTQPRFVVVATPPETHREVVEMALKCPSVDGILCEKPLAPTVDDARAIAAACFARNVTLLVGHQRRYEKRHRKVKEIIESGLIGEPKIGYGAYCRGALNNGTHAADAVRFLGGPQVKVVLREVFKPSLLVTIVGSRGSISLSSYGDLDPGYMNEMYDDLILSTRRSQEPECGSRDGIEAVRLALSEENQWKEENDRCGVDIGSGSQTAAPNVKASNAS